MIGSTPTISVLMAVYNAPLEYLDASIRSILTQSFSDFEFFIVDDGSSQFTRSKLREYAASDQRIKLLRLDSNIGLTKALNMGLEKAKGKYIARQDADDLSYPTRLEESYKFLENNSQLAAAGTNAVIIGVSGNRINDLRIDPQLKGIIRRNILIHGSMMFRRDVLTLVGGYNERMSLAQDYELYLRLIRMYGKQIGVLQKELYSLRQHGDSLSSRKMFRQLYYSVLAKTLTMPDKYADWQRGFFLVTKLAFDFIITHRMFVGRIISGR